MCKKNGFIEKKLLQHSIDFFLTNDISIDKALNWLFIYMENIIMHDVLIFSESIRWSIPFHTQTATLYP